MWLRDGVTGKKNSSKFEATMLRWLRSVKFEKQQYYEDAIYSNQRNPKSMWKKINELVRENKHNSTMECNIPASKVNDFFQRYWAQGNG